MFGSNKNKKLKNRFDAFDLRDIVDKIVTIAKENEENDLFINITGGTNLMAGAATSSAFFVGAKAYYVLEKKDENLPISKLVIELPIPTQPLYLEITGLKREILKVIKKYEEVNKGGTFQKYVCEKLGESAQTVSYHVNDLVKKGLLSKNIDGRKTKIELTPQGELYLRWTE